MPELHVHVHVVIPRQLICFGYCFVLYCVALCCIVLCCVVLCCVLYTEAAHLTVFKLPIQAILGSVLCCVAWSFGVCHVLTYRYLHALCVLLLESSM